MSIADQFGGRSDPVSVLAPLDVLPNRSPRCVLHRHAVSGRTITQRLLFVIGEA